MALSSSCIPPSLKGSLSLHTLSIANFNGQRKKLYTAIVCKASLLRLSNNVGTIFVTRKTSVRYIDTRRLPFTYLCEPEGLYMMLAYPS
ncbi:hypothetical protein E2562_008336 [Oryza meyeriana var. granulata]|uniref:Uncharacterized protein n=1 Tax=Oryza meyeriana var. granulata TaxID=110450 RepID=A0A6G1EHB5_9ORYZ|nr:hypothetical protein E2562_008336 [Oryza meyeriana var. granulata]